MKAWPRWVVRHPTATMRMVTLTLAGLCLWRAVMAQGSPEGSVILGCVAVILLVVASADVEVG